MKNFEKSVSEKKEAQLSFIKKRLDYIIENNFKGYDPYDGCSTSYDFLKSSKLIRLFSQYFNKFSPINLRTLFGIKPQIFPQVLAYFGSIVFTLEEEESYKKELDEAVEILLSRSLYSKYGYHCWNSLGFPLQMRNGYSPVDIPDIVGGSLIGNFFLKYYRKYNSEKVKEAVESQYYFFLNELYVDLGEKAFIKYRPNKLETEATYNATLLAARFLMNFDQEFGEKSSEEITKCFNFVVDQQQQDGQWFYSINLDNKKEKKQVDFHQGFILDCLLDFMENYGFNEPYHSSYQKGLRFYFQNQFLKTGQGLYRYPRKWPANIHNQAQGIITFSKASKFDQKYFIFAKTILDWTFENMQDADDHFYYLKYPMFTNKIEYVRWSDAPMLHAISIHLEN